MSTPPPPQGAVSPQWQAPPRYQPPPAVAPNGQPLASFLDRFLAYIIDQAIYLGVSMIWTIPFVVWSFSEFFSLMETMRQDETPDTGAFLRFYIPVLVFGFASTILGLLFTYIYWVELQMRRGGQTVGKRVMKISVIPVDPGQADLNRSGYAVRWAIQWLVGAVLPLFNLIDGLFQTWDKPLQQCLHDKAAKTVVVKVG